MAKSLGAEGKEPKIGGTLDATALKRYVERAAAVMEEMTELGDSLKEICAEADEAGVATKREIRRLARESLMDQDVLHAQMERMDTLRHALGQFVTTPLGEAAAAQAAESSKRGARIVEAAQKAGIFEAAGSA